MIFEIFISILQMYMLNNFEKNIFPYKVEPCWKRIIIYCGTVLVGEGINRMGSSILNIMLVPISYLITSVIIFCGSIWKKVIIASCYYALAIVPEFLFAAITNAYGVIDSAEQFQTESEKIIAVLLMNTLTFLFIKCINQITRKRNYSSVENKTFTLLLTLPVATIIILSCIFYSQISFEGINRIMLPVGALLLLLTNIFIFNFFDKLIEKSEEARKMESLYQKSRAENMNQQYINKINEDNKAFLHDVNKFLHTLACLINCKENQEIQKMVEHLGVRIEKLNSYYYCHNPVLNSILCERKFFAESKGIIYRVSLGNDLNVNFIEDLDLISIVGNLLDNAIEAAEKANAEKYVDSKIYMGNAGHFLVMEFRNSYSVPLIEEKNGYLTTKRDSRNHGIGLHTVKKLVEKYGGIMKIEAGEQVFSVKLAFTRK